MTRLGKAGARAVITAGLSRPPSRVITRVLSNRPGAPHGRFLLAVSLDKTAQLVFPSINLSCAKVTSTTLKGQRPAKAFSASKPAVVK